MDGVGSAALPIDGVGSAALPLDGVCSAAPSTFAALDTATGRSHERQ